MAECPEGMRLATGVLTSSDTLRTEQCAGAGVYRIAKDLAPPPHGGMWWGIILHRFLEYAMERGHDEARAYVMAKKWVALKATCLKIDLDAIPYGNAEVSFAHNVFERTGRRILKAFAHREMDVQCDQSGKADLVTDPQPGWPRPMVADWKSGYDGELPLESPQMLGLGASRILEDDLEEVDLALVRVHASGQMDWHVQTMTKADELAWTNRARRNHLTVLENRVRAVNGVIPDFVRGPQCDWCDLRPVCPAHK